IAVFGEVVGPCERIMPRKVLPSIGGADETDRPRAPRRRAAERQRIAASRGEEHLAPLMVGEPSGVVRTAIYEVRREEGVEAVVASLAALGLEAYMLENDIAARIGKHELFDDIAAVARHVAQREGGHAIIHRPDRTRGVTLLFREIAAAVGDDEAEIARAGIVDTGIVDLVENAVAQREPHTAFDLGRR